MDRAREQLLASTQFPPQQHRRARLRHDRDLANQRAHRLAVADDAGDRSLAELLLEFGQLFLQAVTFGDKAVAIARQHPVQFNPLTDEVGDHHQETDVEIEPGCGTRIERAVDGERADHLEPIPDRHADEGDDAALIGAERREVGGLEQRMSGGIGDDERHRGRDDLADRLLRHAGAVALRGFLAPSGAHDDIGNAIVVEQHDHSVPHLQKRGQQIDHVRQRRLETIRRGQYFRNLVDADERDLAHGDRRRGRQRPATPSRTGVKHRTRSIVLAAPSPWST